MPVQRGVLYGAPNDPDVAAWLVLTNDDWNTHLRYIGAVPLANPAALDDVPPHSPAVVLDGMGHHAVTAALTSIDRDDDLGSSLGAATDDELRHVEAALIDLLDLRPLLRTPARALPLAPGPLSPMWGDIYFGPPRGERGAEEHKRYVVVSNNQWNVAMPQVVCVRTTTSARRGGPGFPEIQGGRARACCGQTTAIRTAGLELRRRPVPSRLGLQDMVAIARDIVDTYELRL